LKNEKWKVKNANSKEEELIHFEFSILNLSFCIPACRAGKV
jgi:hypothetical protein